MKKVYIIMMIGCLLGLSSCHDVLDVSPLDRVSSDVILSSESGVKVFMANLYSNAPYQDFTYNRLGEHTGNTNTVGIHPDQQTDNAINSEFNHLVDGGGNFAWWQSRYSYLRSVALLFKEVPNIAALSEQKKNEILGEAHFLRGWAYFDLAKRYGGVSIIKEYQEYKGDPDSLRVPRSTEQETWDFVLSEFDQAAQMLPESRDAENARRATKWTALAMKSRAALFAASVAKFWNKRPLSGEAVSLGLVGMDPSLAAGYYKQCLDAAAQVISSGRFQLYKATPASKDEAVNNLMALFQDPNIAPEECMLIKGYKQSGEGHSADFWYGPYQTRDGGPHPGRMNPTLNLIDHYETYSNPGQDAPVITTEDGNYNDYNGFNPSTKYLHFANPTDIFKDKDARLWATVILPYTEWKGKTIRISAGLVRPDGRAVIEANNDPVNVDGVNYYPFGDASMDNYSGFDQSNLSCMTRTGFCFKKFLSPTEVANNGKTGASTQDWCELRYAEVLLNYAEAAVESGQGDQALAKKCLNATRRRAAFMTDIPLTVENVQRERRSELAFECKRWDDLLRRREFHEIFNNRVAKSLDPVLDLRVKPAQWIFIRKNAIRAIPLTFEERFYYNRIPGIAANGLIQNPQY